MGWWLAEKRRNQKTDFMPRFDPRFWTVNFSRPMMASVRTLVADALRFEAVFYNSDDLAGLIWDSADDLDHPLLAYETNRNYNRLTLSFHWQSDGIMPLNAVNGPTLTIEGRDADGQQRSWFVRLWNYASGTPTNADIRIDFADLNGGFLLPAEAQPVWPEDIDRMFISMIPPEFDGQGTRLHTPRQGWVEISNIRSDGQDAVLALGDIAIPEHDLAMATAYDDSFNQTPERLLRAVRALGYRSLINHYVGMSHYFRLETNGTGLFASLSAPAPGEDFAAINQPCTSWHRDFAQRCRAAGYDLILSLSYELFDAHCWEDWKQRAEDGSPALTGYIPPSTLLSPANPVPMGYLQSVARAFVRIALDEGLPVKFQIGEPWWWVGFDDRICLYDDAARAAFGDDLVSIETVIGPKTDAQKHLLDRAGEILAQSTADLGQAVRDEAGAEGAELYLLAYLPTILDDEAPDIERAILPVGWAKPAFDVLQLEDYDWVIAGDRHRSLLGNALASERLGYPVAEQQYLAGFVLNPEDIGVWRNIDIAIADARKRGVSRIIVWALPQTNRDGFTYFQDEDDAVNAFDDEVFPTAIGLGATIIPGFSTGIVTTLSGHEARNSNWADARLEYDVGPGIRSRDDVLKLMQFFRARRGAAKAFRFRDPFDHSSGNMIDAPTGTDQILGLGDGINTRFRLVKNYGPADQADGPQQRLITRPDSSSVVLTIDGEVTDAWTLGALGRIELHAPPADGAIIRAGYVFDVPVRFADDRLELSYATFEAGEAASVALLEVREE